MTSKDVVALTSDQICAIVRACGDSGVRSFEFKHLKLVFFDKDKEVLAPKTEEVHIHMPVDNNPPRKEASKEDLLNELLLTDPEAYERMTLEVEQHGG